MAQLLGKAYEQIAATQPRGNVSRRSGRLRADGQHH